VDESGATLGGCGRRRGPSRPWLSAAWGGSDRERQAWRAAWDCDCEGLVPLRTTSLDHSKAAAARALSTAIERECGSAPHACPHRAFDDPFIGAVLEGFRLARSGGATNLAAYAAMNPPEVLFRGVAAYDRAVDRAMAARRKRDDRRRDGKQSAERALPRGRR
jgi:hypothetical protein